MKYLLATILVLILSFFFFTNKNKIVETKYSILSRNISTSNEGIEDKMSIEMIDDSYQEVSKSNKKNLLETTIKMERIEDDNKKIDDSVAKRYKEFRMEDVGQNNEDGEGVAVDITVEMEDVGQNNEDDEGVAVEYQEPEMEDVGIDDEDGEGVAISYDLHKIINRNQGMDILKMGTL